jgi:hypothetical protein
MRLLSLMVFFVTGFAGFSQNCLSGIINVYTPVINVCEKKSVTVESSSGFNIGSKIMLYQAKGAEIVTSNDNFFGSIADLGNSGNYEFNWIESIVGNTIVFRYQILNSYDFSKGLVQLIFVPEFKSVNVCNLTCLPWNGRIGGVLVFDADTITLKGDINVSGNGFKGAFANTIDAPACGGTYLDFFYSISSALGGEKGEGIYQLSDFKFQAGRGRSANGGGGGNHSNAGGGGGSNIGEGGVGGQTWQGCGPFQTGGLGGIGLAVTPNSNKIYLGGGGGGGHMNDFAGTKGGNGGGIIILNTSYIEGNSFLISANGENVLPNSPTINGDGTGGGGGGGSIILNKINSINNIRAIEAFGGKGGDNNSLGKRDCHGPGGGGGGGLIGFSGSSTFSGTPALKFGGNQGNVINATSSCNNTSYFSMPGAEGGLFSNWIVPTAFEKNDLVLNTKIEINSKCDSIRILATILNNNSFVKEYSLDGINWQSSNIFITDKPGIIRIYFRSQCLVKDTIINVEFSQGLGNPLLIINNESCVSKGSIIVQGEGGTPPYSYSLNNSSPNVNGFFDNLNSGTYQVRVFDSLGCVKLINVNVPSEQKNDTFRIDTAICKGNFILVNGVKIDTTSKFILRLKNYLGCDSLIFVSVTFLLNKDTFIMVEICEGDSVKIGQSFLKEAGLNEIKLNSDFSCDSIVKLFIVFKSNSLCVDCEIYIPNIFSPNFDKVNDNIGPYSDVFICKKFRIFDRWGSLVFLSEEPKPFWNGIYSDGRIGEQGVYVFIVEGVCPNGKKILKGGEFTLIR